MNLGLFVLGVLVVGLMYLVARIVAGPKVSEVDRKDRFKELKEKLDELKAQTEKTNSIRDRLYEAAKIAEQQNELRAQAEMPSKNSLHSRYKNSIIRQVYELEMQKVTLLKTVLAEGFDPTITIYRDSNNPEEMKLSDYVAQAEETIAAYGGYDPQPQGQQPADENSEEPRRAGRFLVYTGGKTDTETTH